jgi:hypothetical protein
MLHFTQAAENTGVKGFAAHSEKEGVGVGPDAGTGDGARAKAGLAVGHNLLLLNHASHPNYRNHILHQQLERRCRRVCNSL